MGEGAPGRGRAQAGVCAVPRHVDPDRRPDAPAYSGVPGFSSGGRRAPLWPQPGRDRALPSPTELAAWGMFSSSLAAVLTVVVGAGADRAMSLGVLGLTTTVALWAAARYGGGPAWARPPGEPPAGA
jgi:hypothetical protein